MESRRTMPSLKPSSERLGRWHLKMGHPEWFHVTVPSTFHSHIRVSSPILITASLADLKLKMKLCSR